MGFSPSGQFLASGSSDNTVRMWDLQNDTVQILPGHGRIVPSVAFSPDSQYVASGSSDNTVRMWDLQNSNFQELSTHIFSKILSVAFSPDGQFLASGSNDRAVRIWDLRSIAYTPEQKLLILKIFDNYSCPNEMVINLKKYVSGMPERAKEFIQQRVPGLLAV